MFKIGDRVRLLPTDECPEAFGEVIGEYDNGVQMVRLDDEYLDQNPDCLCEVPVEDMELCQPSKHS